MLNYNDSSAVLSDLVFHLHRLYCITWCIELQVFICCIDLLRIHLHLLYSVTWCTEFQVFICCNDLLSIHLHRLYRVTWCIELQFDRKIHPPPGGFSIYYVPWSRAGCKRFHDEMRPSHLVVKSFTPGSWSGNVVNRKPPLGGGVLSIKLFINCIDLLRIHLHLLYSVTWCI